MSEEETGQEPEGVDDSPDVEVRPTLFVAVGGTGMEVLLRLRRRILQADWHGTRINSLSEFPVAQFLYFDTDTNEARETGRAATTDPMTAAVAFGKGDTLQVKVDVSYYQKNKRNHPAIDEWLPSRDLSRIDTEKGAGQIRAISRLLFFDQFDVLRSILSEKGRSVISNVSNAPALSRLGLKTQNQLRVVVVGSVAGGTGSGAFIDLGLALRSMVSPKAAQTDLFLVLPGGYVGANRDRVFANTFAALSELEHVMRPDPAPTYVNYWTSVEQPAAGVTKPYNEVYLFDTRNLNNDSTERVTDIFDMMADILFEDFGSSDFASRKRSVAVNQEQHKMRLFYPPLSDDYGRNPLAYSQGYSAVGQSTVATTGSLEFEAAVVDAGRTMLEAFFGVAAGRQRRQPSPEDRDRFMADNLGLVRRAYSDFPTSMRAKPPAIAGYGLIDLLLQLVDKSSVDGHLLQDIDDSFQRIRETVNDPSDWGREASSIRTLRERDVLGAVGQKVGVKYGLRGDQIVDAKERMLKALKADTGDKSLKTKLYALLDDQEHAGLDYTIELIQQIKARLTDEGEGVKAVLSRAEDQFAKVADQIMTTDLADSMSRLERAGKKGIMGNVDRPAALKCLTQVQDDLKFALQFKLRALAASEAGLLLEDIAAFMGDKLPAEEDGEPRWTGLIREFTDGNRSVQLTLDLIKADAERVRDAIKRPDGGVFIVIGGASKDGIETDRGQALDWARQAFKDFGGCRSLFTMLRTEGERLKVLNQLRTIAKEKLAHIEERIPTAVDALRAMTPDERRKVLERMLSRSMPWIHAQFDRGYRPKGDQFKMIIAVADARGFQDEFRASLLALMPKGLGMELPDIKESGVKGRILCYCELSGIPLDAIDPLRDDWRKSYDKELSARDPLPLHNHEDYLRFPNPVAPTNAELDMLRDDLSMFLRGVAFGILRRRAGAGAPYEIDLSVNDWQSVGSERTVRRKRFNLDHRKRLEQQLQRYDGAMTPLQILAASALFAWTAEKAYAPRVDRQDDKETWAPGLTNKVATDLAKGYYERFQALRPAPTLAVSPAQSRERLQGKIEAWTIEIPNSLDDVESIEANRSKDVPVEKQAVNKRTIDSAAFTEDALAAIIDPAKAAAAAAPPPPPPAPPPAGGPVSFYVAVDGQTTGPFDLTGLRGLFAQGQLTRDSQVYDVATGGPWKPASGAPSLAALFIPPPPPLAG